MRSNLNRLVRMISGLAVVSATTISSGAVLMGPNTHNGSFEMPDNGANGRIANDASRERTEWTSPDYEGGDWILTNSTNQASAGEYLVKGRQGVPLLNQNLGAQVQDGYTYTLASDTHMSVSGSVHPLTILQATDGNNTVDLVTLTGPGNTTYQTDSDSYNADGTYTGRDLQVAIKTSSTGSKARGYFDNINLTAVPEPASLSLIGAGLALFIARPRRRRGGLPM